MFRVFSPQIQADYFTRLLLTRWSKDEFELIPNERVMRLETPTFRIVDPILITMWVDSKIPYPELIPRDPDSMVQVLSVLARMFRQPETEKQRLVDYLRLRRPFLLGKRLTVLDLWAASHADDSEYCRAVDAAIEKARVAL